MHKNTQANRNPRKRTSKHTIKHASKQASTNASTLANTSLKPIVGHTSKDGSIGTIAQMQKQQREQVHRHTYNTTSSARVSVWQCRQSMAHRHLRQKARLRGSCAPPCAAVRGTSRLTPPHREPTRQEVRTKPKQSVVIYGFSDCHAFGKGAYS